MKKIASRLIFAGLAVFAYWFVGKIIGPVLFIRMSTPSVFSLGIFLILAAICLRLLNKEKIFVMPSKKMLFLSSCIIMAGLSLFYYRQGMRKFIYQQVCQVLNRSYLRLRMFDIGGWLGVKSVQFPTDNWMLQEMIYEIKPDFIVETGTFKGGTALFYATVLEKVNPSGKVITVDIESQIEEAGKHKVFQDFVEFIEGDSVSAEVIDKIAKRVKNGKVLVLLDSLHTKEHVLKELDLYSKFVSLNSYIVVEDTFFSSDSNAISYMKEGGAKEAVEEFLKNNNNFVVDRTKEKYIITQYSGGYLKRVR